MVVTLVRATGADIAEIVALMNLAYRGGQSAAWNTESYISGTRITEALLREEIAAHPEASQLIWKSGGAILGSVWLAPTSDDVWYLGSFAIHPDAQNGGVGRELLTAAERWARDHGAKSIKMTVVHIRAGLLAWYERRGYALTDETEPFPYGDDRFGTPLRDDLYFAVLRKQLI